MQEVSSKKIALVYNPAAGKLQRNPKLLDKTTALLSSMGKVERRPTTGPNTGGAIAKECVENGASLVVSLGGDGTIHEVMNGMVGTDVPLAALPGGTANVLCVEVGLGTRIERAASELAKAEPVRISVGEMIRPSGERRYFLLMAGVGVDALVVNEVNPDLKRLLGKVAYWVSGFAMFGRMLPQFQTAGTPLSFALASRVRNYGGDLEIAKNVSLLENCFELVSFTGRNSLRYLPYLAAVAVGKVDQCRGVSVSPCYDLDCVPMNGEPVPIQLDGEAAGVLPASFRIVPDALTIMLPSRYVQRARERRWIMSHTR